MGQGHRVALSGGARMDWDLVIFDCDGVLIDSELLSVEADIACLAEHGIAMSADDILERYTGISMAGMLADLEQRHGREFPGFGDRHRQRLEELFEAGLRPIAGIEAALDALPARSCVASSSRPERLRHALSLVGLFDRFDRRIFSATQVAHGKPAPDLFLFAADRLGAAPARCVVIEDSLPGIEAAVAAGMTAIGLTGGSHCRPGYAARLYQQGAAAVIDSMAELLTALALAHAQAARIERPSVAFIESAPGHVPPNKSSG
jgi:HAD superfamily hydrolase (TIGR01509 family)